MHRLPRTHFHTSGVSGWFTPLDQHRKLQDAWSHADANHDEKEVIRQGTWLPRTRDLRLTARRVVRTSSFDSPRRRDGRVDEDGELRPRTERRNRTADPLSARLELSLEASHRGPLHKLPSLDVGEQRLHKE